MPRDYWWYDSEDGEDIWKKVNFAAKISTLFALPVVNYDFFIYSSPTPTTISQFAWRFCAVTGPIVGMGTIFAFTSQMLCKNVPQMDPKLSYMIGGFSAGSVMGAVRRSPFAGCLVGSYLAILALTIRVGHEENWAVPWDKSPIRASNDTTWDTVDLSLTKAKDLGPPASYPGFGF